MNKLDDQSYVHLSRKDVGGFCDTLVAAQLRIETILRETDEELKEYHELEHKLRDEFHRRAREKEGDIRKHIENSIMEELIPQKVVKIPMFFGLFTRTVITAAKSMLTKVPTQILSEKVFQMLESIKELEQKGYAVNVCVSEFYSSRFGMSPMYRGYVRREVNFSVYDIRRGIDRLTLGVKITRPTPYMDRVKRMEVLRAQRDRINTVGQELRVALGSAALTIAVPVSQIEFINTMGSL